MLPLILMENTFSETGDLIINGNITNKNNGDEYVIKKSQMDRMEKTVITTGTSWTPVSDFEGVKVSSILSLVGANGDTLSMHAINDYEVDIPVSDVSKYQIILATKINGMLITTRDYGPYFVIYPRDEYREELDRPKFLARFIWQVDKITVK